MDYVRTNRQWMVVGPVNMADGSWEGKRPILGNFYPSYRPDDWITTTGRSGCSLSFGLVPARGEDWELMPRMPFPTGADQVAAA